LIYFLGEPVVKCIVMSNTYWIYEWHGGCCSSWAIGTTPCFCGIRVAYPFSFLWFVFIWFVCLLPV